MSYLRPQHSGSGWMVLTVTNNIVGEVGIQPHSCADCERHVGEPAHHKAGYACAGSCGRDQVFSCLILTANKIMSVSL